ncbi:hypothetical protein [Aggregatibacter sp.]
MIYGITKIECPKKSPLIIGGFLTLGNFAAGNQQALGFMLNFGDFIWCNLEKLTKSTALLLHHSVLNN